MKVWESFIDISHGWGVGTFILRFVVAILVGTMIGIDRERKNRGAGVKTHVLVCLGSALAMMTSQYVAVNFPYVKNDMTRIGAQVISGVGFLGVGTIMVTGKNQVRGLTTAAGLWACASVGLAIGIGFVEGGIIATLMIMFTLKVLNYVDRTIYNHARYFDLYIEFSGNEGLICFRKDLAGLGVKCHNFIPSKKAIRENVYTATVTIELPDIKGREEMLEKIESFEYIQYMEKL